jgi:CRP-like cAMP-binding protein
MGFGGGDLACLQSSLRKVRLTRGQVLHPAGEPIKQIYFPDSGMISMLTVLQSGEQIETAIIGTEGVAGGSVAIGGANTNTQTTVQIEGSGWQLPAANFLETYNASDRFRSEINGYQGIILFQAQQNAACHALHCVESRLCRWLLQTGDLIGSDQIELTQELLSHMLGVRRTSVSLSAHKLQNFGLIHYSRGKIKIVDRDGLAECACECYAAIRQRIGNSIPPIQENYARRLASMKFRANAFG